MRLSSTLLCLAAISICSPRVAEAQALPEGAEAAASELPVEEVHIRSGIMILAKIYQSLASVQDRDSAQAAVPTLVQLTRELQAWGRGIANLPPLSESTRVAYEARYTSTIRKLNDHLRAQGERLAASDYFGSKDLSTALISLYVSAQQ